MDSRLKKVLTSFHEKRRRNHWWHQVEFATNDLGIELHKDTPHTEVIKDCLMRGAMIERILPENDIFDKWTWQKQLIKNDLHQAMCLLIQAHPEPEKILKDTFEELYFSSNLIVNAVMDVINSLLPSDAFYPYLVGAVRADNLVLVERLLAEHAPLQAPEGGQVRLGEAINSVEMFEFLDAAGYIWQKEDLFINSFNPITSIVNNDCPNPDLFRAMAKHPSLSIHYPGFAEKAWNTLLRARTTLSSKLKTTTLEMAKELIERGIPLCLTDKTNLFGVWVLTQIGMAPYDAIQFIDCKERLNPHNRLGFLIKPNPEVEDDHIKSGRQMVLDLLTGERASFRERLLIDKNTSFNTGNTKDPRRF